MKALLLLLSLNASAQDTTRRDTIWIDKIDSSRFKIIVTNLRTGKSDTTVSHVLGNGGYAPKKRLWRKWQRRKARKIVICNPAMVIKPDSPMIRRYKPKWEILKLKNK